MKNQPKILIYDIETSYVVTKEHRWGLYDERPIHQEIVQDWQILCFAYKWLGDKKVKVVAQPDFKDYKAGKLNDKNVVKALRDLFDKADIVIAHNGNAFDQKKVHARMMVHHMTPPAPYSQIDTKLAVKRVSSHTSHKLSDLCKSLELEHKLDAGGIKTWDGCMAGDPKSWRHMKTYNKGDIISLEALYLELRPWIKNHPRVSSMSGRPDSCDSCGSEKMHQHTKKTYAKKGWKYQYKCYNCGAYKMGDKIHKFENFLV